MNTNGIRTIYVVIITPNNIERPRRILSNQRNKSDGDVSISYPHKGVEAGRVIETEEHPVYINKIGVRFRAMKLDGVRLLARTYKLDQSVVPTSLYQSYSLGERYSYDQNLIA